MKQSFEEYIISRTDRPVEDHGFSDLLLETMKKAFKLGVVPGVLFTPENARKSDEAKIDILNTKLRESYKIQLHGVGKNPFQRYFAYEGNFAWLKLEHYLISHFYAIKKDVTSISNRSIAIKLGWLSALETDPQMIWSAEKKVIENLAKLKTDRQTISVEQRYNKGKMGSYHVIKANWFVIIPLYSTYDPNKQMTIRQRKGIRYRILSLVLETVKTFTEGLRRLLDAQRTKFLSGLLTLDHAEFKAAKDIWKDFVDEYHLNEFLKDPNCIVPEWIAPNMHIEIKDPKWENLLHELDVFHKFREYSKRELIVKRHITRSLYQTA